jgi:transposase
MDVHKKSWTIAICTVHREYRPFNISPPEVVVLVDYLQTNFPQADYTCAYEAGFSGFGLCESLKEHGINCLVVNAADIPTADRDAEFKTDPRDAAKIARCLRSGELHSIHIPTKTLQGDRGLARLHDQFKRDVIRQKCRIKMNLYYFGLKIPAQYDDQGRWSRPFISWLYNVEMPSPNATVLLKNQMGQFIYVLGMKRNTEAWLRALSKTPAYQKQTDLLLSVPGIGRLTAIKFLLQLGQIQRFRNLNALCNYIGLVPGSKNSGERVRQNRLTRRGHTQLRSMLVEAAWVAIGVDPALSQGYQQLKKRMIAQKAIIRIARKLLSRIRYVLLHEMEYEKGIIA